MKRYLLILLMLCSLPAFAQADRHDVRAGNRKFRGGRFQEAEIDYRKAALKDSTSLHAQYNLASALYRQETWQGASEALAKVKDRPDLTAAVHYNAGDAALQQKDYRAAVDAFRQALLLDPADLDAKENYIYAKKMMENQQNGGGGDNQQDQNQDQDKNQDQDQNQDQQNQDQNQQDQQNQDQQDQQQDQQPQISPQQAQQMLRAIQAKEQETQDKVNREKAALLKSRQKEKNW